MKRPDRIAVSLSKLEKVIREAQDACDDDKKEDTIKKATNLKCRELDAIFMALGAPPLFHCPECDGELTDGIEPNTSVCVNCGWMERGET
jgi:hypothetical protein